MFILAGIVFFGLVGWGVWHVARTIGHAFAH